MMPIFKIANGQGEDDYDEWRCESETLAAVYVNFLDGTGFMCHYANKEDKNVMKECNEILLKSKHY